MAIPTFAMNPFQPAYDGVTGLQSASISLAVNGASQVTRVLPDPPAQPFDPKLRQVRIANLGTNDADVAFVTFSDENGTASTTTSMAIPRGDVEVFTMGRYTHISYISAGSGFTLNVTPGGGV